MLEILDLLEDRHSGDGATEPRVAVLSYTTRTNMWINFLVSSLSTILRSYTYILVRVVRDRASSVVSRLSVALDIARRGPAAVARNSVFCVRLTFSVYHTECNINMTWFKYSSYIDYIHGILCRFHQYHIPYCRLTNLSS